MLSLQNFEHVIVCATGRTTRRETRTKTLNRKIRRITTKQCVLYCERPQLPFYFENIMNSRKVYNRDESVSENKSCCFTFFQIAFTASTDKGTKPRDRQNILAFEIAISSITSFEGDCACVEVAPQKHLKIPVSKYIQESIRCVQPLLGNNIERKSNLKLRTEKDEPCMVALHTMHAHQSRVAF